MRHVAVTLLSAIFWLGSALQAQNADLPHLHPQSKMIDGAVHPELIPDIAAYRLYLLAVARSATPTEQERRHQAAQLGVIGLSEADGQTAISILATFKDQYQSLINVYNQQAKAAWTKGERPDIAAFLLQRDQIVQLAHDALKVRLSSVGWSQLDAHVMGEKKRMKISAKEESQ